MPGKKTQDILRYTTGSISPPGAYRRFTHCGIGSRANAIFGPMGWMPERVQMIKRYDFDELLKHRTVQLRLGGLDYLKEGQMAEDFEIAAVIVEEMHKTAEEEITKMTGQRCSLKKFCLDHMASGCSYPTHVSQYDFISGQKCFCLSYISEEMSSDENVKRYALNVLAAIDWEHEKPVCIYSVGFYMTNDDKWCMSVISPYANTAAGPYFCNSIENIKKVFTHPYWNNGEEKKPVPIQEEDRFETGKDPFARYMRLLS